MSTSRELEVAALKADEWTKRRNALIRQRHEEGASLRDIAAEAAMTHAGVSRILKKPTPRRE